MVEKDFVIKSESGLQAKTAAVFIQKASAYKSTIWVEKDERKANAKSLLGLLSLGIQNGTGIRVIAEGEDEAEALQGLEEFLAAVDRDGN